MFLNQPKLNFNYYIFPIDLQLDGIIFGAKSIGKFGLNRGDSGINFFVCKNARRYLKAALREIDF